MLELYVLITALTVSMSLSAVSLSAVSLSAVSLSAVSLSAVSLSAVSLSAVSLVVISLDLLPFLKMEAIKTFGELSRIKGFKITHLNVRSILKKIDQLRTLLLGLNLDVITFSETWLGPHVHSGLLNLDGFQLFRADRQTGRGKKKRGGGLITYVRGAHSSSCEQLCNLDISSVDMEAQWILIHRPHCKNVIICNLYRPPNGNLKTAMSYLETCLSTINLDKADTFLLGDMNVDFQNKLAADFKKINFFIQSNSLTQHVNTTTRNTEKTNTLLDVVISNSRFISHSGTLNHFISDHQPIFVVHKKGRDKRESVKFKGRSYRNFDEQLFRDRLLHSINWEDYYKIDQPDRAWEFILGHINKLLDELCPIRTFFIKNYRPDWMTDELIEQIKDRDYFYKKAKASGDKDAWNIAKYLRNITNSNIRQAKRDFILNELTENEDNSKKFWKVIRKVIPSKQTARQNVMLRDNGRKVDKHLVADFINDFFINVGKIDRPNVLPAASQPPDCQTRTIESSVEEAENLPSPKSFDRLTQTKVFKVIKAINVSKSSGIDNVSSYVLKVALSTLVAEVTHMYNLSLTKSVFPTLWKKALVVPIPKTGNLASVHNYRPISLLPLPGKILEKLVHEQIIDHLDGGSLLSDKQHGFRRAHSTIHATAQLVEFVNINLDRRRPTLAVYIDFRKAFDCVQHDVLINKLKDLDLHYSVIEWARSYLTGRQQRVLANDVFSEYKCVSQGVPQGSVLGPLFYIIYANDLSRIFKHCKFALYADDTVLYTACNNFEDSVANLQRDITLLGSWCVANGIMVNTTKTKVMVFGSNSAIDKLQPFEILYNNAPLPQVTSYNYLGVTLDHQLNYNLHVKRLISSISAKLKQFQRMRSFLTVKAAVLVYKNMLLPILEYGDIFLSATSAVNRKKLQTLQNKGLRCALNKGINESSSNELHNEVGLLKLMYRREQHLLNFVYDWSLDVSKLKVRSNGAISTRSSLKKIFKLRKPRTEKLKKSFAYKGKSKWNRLPVEFHHAQAKSSYKLLVHNLIVKKSKRSSEACLQEENLNLN